MSAPREGDALPVWVSTACARAPRDLAAVLERYVAAGLHHIELSAPHPALPPAELERYVAAGLHHIELSAPHPALPPAELAGLLQRYRERGVRFLLHNYFPAPEHEMVLNLASTDARILEQTHALVSGALELAGALEAPLYACHAGYRAYAVCLADGRFRFTELDEAGEVEAYRQLLESVEQILDQPAVTSGRVAFAVENLFPDVAGPNHSFCCAPDEIASLLDRFEAEGLGLLLDLGHLDISANLLGFDRDKALDFLLRWYGGRIREVHLSGNDRKRDLHRPLEAGDWQLHAAREIRAARSAEPPCFTVEARDLDVSECCAQVERVREALG